MSKATSATKIVVVGGSGFCGRSMVKLLSQKGYQLLNLDLNPPKELFKSEEFQNADIISGNHLAEKFKGAKAVINLAGRQFATPPKPPKVISTFVHIGQSCQKGDCLLTFWS